MTSNSALGRPPWLGPLAPAPAQPWADTAMTAPDSLPAGFPLPGRGPFTYTAHEVEVDSAGSSDQGSLVDVVLPSPAIPGRQTTSPERIGAKSLIVPEDSVLIASIHG